MTNEEAKEKWCPMVRHCESTEPAANCGAISEHRNPKWARCIGAECALWAFSAQMHTQGVISILENSGHCGFIK